MVACIERAPLHKALAAFIITSEPPSLFEQLKNELRQQLPDYMVPTLWQRVADFPNTDNGKIDRKRLAENFVADSSLVSPQTQALSDTEQMLLALWMRYLPIKTSILSAISFAWGTFAVGGNVGSRDQPHFSLRLDPEGHFPLLHTTGTECAYCTTIYHGRCRVSG